MTPQSHADKLVKEPNVSGQFYPSDPTELSQEINGYISSAKVSPYKNNIEVLIAPHAGYFYSGPVAGYSFKSVSENKYKTIVILAPSHFFGFDAVSVWPKGAFKTPLGEVVVDNEFAEKLIGTNDKIYFEPKAFDKEHALEVEIPFLQKTFKDFKIVPLILGQASLETLDQLAVKLVDIIRDRNDVLIVVSTDLSHYHPDSVARQMDGRSLEAVREMNIQALWQGHMTGQMEMCGVVPVTAALFYAKHKGLNQVDLLHYGNSGDVTGEKDRVVGYGAAVIYAK